MEPARERTTGSAQNVLNDREIKKCHLLSRVWESVKNFFATIGSYFAEKWNSCFNAKTQPSPVGTAPPPALPAGSLAVTGAGAGQSEKKNIVDQLTDKILAIAYLQSHPIQLKLTELLRELQGISQGVRVLGESYEAVNTDSLKTCLIPLLDFYSEMDESIYQTLDSSSWRSPPSIGSPKTSKNLAGALERYSEISGKMDPSIQGVPSRAQLILNHSLWEEGGFTVANLVDFLITIVGIELSRNTFPTGR
jgi:hypothetical protein